MNNHLTIKPISLRQANSFVEQFHRHHGKVQGAKFAIAVYFGNEICGVSICGRPLNRFLDDGSTLEVLRLCTDGTYNACSILYARSARIAREMGYNKIITYILESENGTSLKASGWTLEKESAGGGSWTHSNRRIDDRLYHQGSFFEEKPKYPTEVKKRFCKML